VWVDASGGAAYQGFANALRGLTVGSDHGLYALNGVVYRVGPDRKVTAVTSDRLNTALGLVSLPRGAFATGTAASVQQISSGGTTLLAGSAGRPRTVGKPVPTAVAAAGFHFAAGGPVPVAARSDGTVLVADTDVLWSLKSGRLTRRYQLPAAQARSGGALEDFGAVDGSGTAYVSAGRRLSDVVAVGSDGTARPLTLPATVSGVTGRPGALRLEDLTGDGAHGVYALVSASDHSYVLHLHDGTAQLVVRESSDASTGTCHLPHPVRATALPCALPTGISYGTDGSLYLAGQAPYVLKVAVA
jgi:hypothetical protein